MPVRETHTHTQLDVWGISKCFVAQWHACIVMKWMSLFVHERITCTNSSLFICIVYQRIVACADVWSVFSVLVLNLPGLFTLVQRLCSCTHLVCNRRMQSSCNAAGTTHSIWALLSLTGHYHFLGGCRLSHNCVPDGRIPFTVLVSCILSVHISRVVNPVDCIGVVFFRTLTVEVHVFRASYGRLWCLEWR